jgi:hypothetical protein
VWTREKGLDVYIVTKHLRTSCVCTECRATQKDRMRCGSCGQAFLTFQLANVHRQQVHADTAGRVSTCSPHSLDPKLFLACS